MGFTFVFGTYHICPILSQAYGTLTLNNAHHLSSSDQINSFNLILRQIFILCVCVCDFRICLSCLFIQQVSPANSSGPSPSRSFKAVNGSPSQIAHMRSQLPQRPVSSIVSTQQSSASVGSRDPTRRQSIPSGRPSQVLPPENGPQPPRSSDGPKMVQFKKKKITFINFICAHTVSGKLRNVSLIFLFGLIDKVNRSFGM